MTIKKNKLKKRKLIKAQIHLCKIEDIDFQKIISGFSVKRKSDYDLPRIAFIGYFDSLSMGCQRHIAKNLGFEYYSGIPFAVSSEVQLQILTTKWSEIFREFTRLIVIGNRTFTGWDNGIPVTEPEFCGKLFRTYKKSDLPIYAEFNIPIIMESELIKLHSEYPNIDNSTKWCDEPKRPILTSLDEPQQRNLLDLV